MKRKSWQEKIVDGLKSQDGRKLWHSSKMLRQNIARNENQNIDDVPMSFTCWMKVLIKNGFVERALKPRELIRGQYVQKEYLYRLTEKPFKAVPRGYRLAKKNKFVTQEQIDLGYDLWVKYKHLPKWFRNMMK
jgi:hypothetical protein